MSISWGEIGVSAFSVLASAGVSVYISKRTAKAEIEKLKAIWAHEKEAACDSDFDAMVAAVSLYAKYPSPANFQSATNAVGIYRAKATGEAVEKVDELSRLIVRECPNCTAVSDQLQAVIECKRKA